MFPIKGMFDQGTVPTLERAVAFSEARQRVIAHNLSNAETPGYQAKDLPFKRFQSRLKESILNRRWGNPRAYSFRDDKSMHDSHGFLQVNTLENKLGLMRHSQNNVDIDRENAKMSRNAMYHTLMTQLLNRSFTKMQSAIRGRA